MNVTVFCDDDVSIVVNITNRTKAEEVIRQIITLRRSMTALADVETDECTLSIDAEGSRQLLSRKSLLMSLLTSPPIAPLQPAYRITALGFRAKAAALSRAAKDHRYLIERKMLELQHLAAAHGSQLSSQLAPLLQIADSSCRIAPDTDADNNKSSSSSSSNKHYKNFSSSESDDFSPGVSIYGDLQKNYDDFALNVRKALAAWRITLKGSGDDRTIFDIGIVEGESATSFHPLHCT